MLLAKELYQVCEEYYKENKEELKIRRSIDRMGIGEEKHDVHTSHESEYLQSTYRMAWRIAELS